MARTGNGLKIFTTGFLVLLFWAILLFWADWFCRKGIASANFRRIEAVWVMLEGMDRKNDPNFFPCSLLVSLGSGLPASVLGEPAWAPMSDARRSVIGKISTGWDVFQYDAESGLFEWKYYEGTLRRQKGAAHYLGPGGISPVKKESLGRFRDPFLYKDEQEGKLFIYDRQLRQFFHLDLCGMEPRFSAGPVLGDSIEPIQFGSLQKGREIDVVVQEARRWRPPKTGQTGGYAGRWWETVPSDFRLDTAGPWLLVLDADGQILRLNKESLCIEGPAGRLPAPVGLFGSRTEGRPEKLSAYRVYPVCREKNGQLVYYGCCAASAAPEGVGLAVECFDAQGQMTGYDMFRSPAANSVSGYYQEVLLSKLFERGDGALAITARFFADSLQPAVFHGLSFLCAEAIEPRAGMRALFLRPHSFIGILRRCRQMGLPAQFFWAFLMLLPSLLVGLGVGLCLRRKSLSLGGSSRAARGWFALGILFGVPAWITFHLVRPREKEVTCLNCGSLRRPDQMTCHVCRAGWDFKGLESPDWCLIEPLEESESPVGPALSERQTDL